MIKTDIENRLKMENKLKLSIEPLLEKNQIGELTVDLRLGYDFLVSVVTRRPYIGIFQDDENFRNVSSYFQLTRRELGDSFILYPNQIVLAMTLEFIGLPDDCFANLLMRSSYARLGISISATIAEPGFRGCFSIELFNHGNNPIELVVGSRIFQMQLTQLSTKISIDWKNRKYYGNIRPIPSKAIEDSELNKLKLISKFGN